MNKLKLALSWFKRNVMKKVIADYVRKGHHTIVTGILGHSGANETWIGSNRKVMNMKIIWNQSERYVDTIDDHFISSSWEFLGFEDEAPLKTLSLKDYIKTMEEFNKLISDGKLKKRVDTRSMDSLYRKALGYGA